MPPRKKSEKAIAAERKKANTLKARNILDEVKKGMGKAESGGALVVKKPSSKKSVKDEPVKSNKKPTEAVVANSNRTQIMSNVQDNVSTTISQATMQTILSTNVTGGGSIDENYGVSIEKPPNESTSNEIEPMMSEPTSTPKEMKIGKSTEIVATKGSVVVSKVGSVHNPGRKLIANVANKSQVKSKTGSSHGSGYQYEIDCTNVADSIDVNDVKLHLEKHLKINGKKNNFGNAVSIVCEKQKVIIKSKTFFPKKALRFLSKKFLKKNWNIQVLSKNVHSYEYKYVGTM